MNIAFLMIEIANLSGSGGAERFAADFFNLYNGNSPNRKLFFLSDDFSRLVEAGRLNASPFLRKIPSFRCRFRRLAGSRFRPMIEWIDRWIGALFIVLFCSKNRVSILHIPLYTDRYFILLKRIRFLSSLIHPLRFAIFMVDNRMAHNYFSDAPQHASMNRTTYGRLFETFPLDGILTYYDTAKHLFEQAAVLASRPVVRVIKTRFTMMPFRDNRIPKEKLVVWAGRLDEFKRPMVLLEALRMMNRSPELEAWRFEMFGRGYLKDEILRFIETSKLQGRVTLNHVPDMRDIFERSSCYISTQDYENFPSQSMAEAMAKGNAIIARNVGGTSLYLHHNVNGLMLEDDTPESLVHALEELLPDTDRIARMGNESINVLNKYHAPEGFVKEIEAFWTDIESIPRQVLSNQPRPLKER